MGLLKSTVKLSLSRMAEFSGLQLGPDSLTDRQGMQGRMDRQIEIQRSVLEHGFKKLRIFGGKINKKLVY